MTPTARIEAIGSRKTLALTAIVDTGFDGYICLPIRLAVQLGLELIGDQLIELADGTQRKELVFAGSVGFLGETREVEIILTNSEDALVGTSLLDLYSVAIEFPGGKVKVRTPPKSGGKRKST
jgi:clan AA aspartic protease